MVKHGKKYRAVRQKVVRSAVMPAQVALHNVKDLAYTRFDESVDVHINLGIDVTKGEHATRGSVILPHGTGKIIKILVLAKGDVATQAQQAGADYVGAEELIDKINGGWFDYHYVVAHRDMTAMLGKIAKALGPRGLLPNPKLGTVTDDVVRVVNELKKGRSFFRNDKGGIVHFSLGKVSFDVTSLYENLLAFVKSLVAAKPAPVKGSFIKKITVASTMGVGMGVDVDALLRS